MAELRSDLCKKWDPRAEKQFAEHLEKTLELKDLDFSTLAEHAARVEGAPSQRETDSAIAKAARALKHTEAELLPALGIATFFLKQFTSSGRAHGDDPAGIVFDLVPFPKR
jgi:hypothetical protein